MKKISALYVWIVEMFYNSLVNQRAKTAEAEVDRLKAENERLRNLVQDHHTSHVLPQLRPGEVCPVCMPEAAREYGDTIPATEHLGQIIQRLAHENERLRALLEAESGGLGG